MGFAIFNTWGTIICQTDNYSYYNIYNNHENHNDNGNINNNYENVNDNLNYIINTCNNKYMRSMESNDNDDIKTAFFNGIIRHPYSAFPWVCSCMQSLMRKSFGNLLCS